MPDREDFRTTKVEEKERIKRGILERGNATERQADQWAEQRINRAMPRVVRHCEEDGTSPVIDIRSE